MCELHVRSILSYCSIMCSITRWVDRLEIENVQRTSAERLLGYSLSLNYMERCTKLYFDPIWLLRFKTNLSIFPKIIGKNVCISSPQVGNNFFGLQCAEFVMSFALSRIAPRKHSITKYSSIWNKLPHHTEMISPASANLKMELGR